ncbi:MULTISPECIES: TRAP transporter substrate-binding protein [Sulfitobacter]|uniref:TRAP transporter substrate-binding protein n=1 Tax=Sulfitobacter TaxID=60136 RepID=UPI002307F409|nr:MULTISPECIES: TRAP transporter substrate-binding protein [Sulfitobacter]MDF3382646.1 TRAP transporter substrate-binding protein [Sulfitobacter sp. Ks11]MDF3386065.1 TRAP transporter substrate-binding protein [Sulfitobacter sp. M85]MDF3389484.1 TRAP transporter substrate-binding protein [Sulfitobacter sp. Ks16]MDF3400121.1 TRAP transporter substrate-binding protein [Sulfitobacter sp. KE39]MDF3403542.1 TRAP transporter substrate-binding protein [Sulfitobacter sp. Ks35]
MKHFFNAAAVGLAGAIFALPAMAQEHNPFDWRSIPEQEDQITMKIGHSVNMEWSSHTATLKRFAELVAIYTDNEIRGEIYPGAQLGGEREMLQQARQGALHVTLPATNNAAALAPSLNVFILPYLATSTDQVNYLQDELTPYLVPRVIKEAGVRIVGWENSGWRSFFYKSDNPIEKPADLADLKMRVPPNPIMIASYEAWGGKPTPIAWSELYSALQQGVVEGGDNPVPDVMGMKFNEVVNRMTTFHYTILTHPIMVSERWFQGLSEDHQEAILRAGEEATQYIRWWQPLDAERYWDMAREAGIEITKIEDETEWMEKARAIWPDYYDAIGPDGEQVVEKAREILDGYPGDE